MLRIYALITLILTVTNPAHALVERKLSYAGEAAAGWDVENATYDSKSCYVWNEDPVQIGRAHV